MEGRQFIHGDTYKIPPFPSWREFNEHFKSQLKLVIVREDYKFPITLQGISDEDLIMIWLSYYGLDSVTKRAE